MSEEYEDKPSLYKALRGLISGEEFVNPYRFGETSFAQNPKSFIDRTDPSYQESIYAEPTELPSKVLFEGQYFSKRKPEDEFSRPYDMA